MDRPAAPAERYLLTRATAPPKRCRSRHSRVCPTFRGREPELDTFSSSPRPRSDRYLPLSDRYLPRSALPHTTLVYPMQGPLERRDADPLVAPSSTQLSTTCVRIVGMAEAESLGAGARDLKVLGRRPAAEARRAVTLAMSSLLRKRSRDMSCQCRRVGLYRRLRPSIIARRGCEGRVSNERVRPSPSQCAGCNGRRATARGVHVRFRRGIGGQAERMRAVAVRSAGPLAQWSGSQYELRESVSRGPLLRAARASRSEPGYFVVVREARPN